MLPLKKIKSGFKIHALIDLKILLEIGIKLVLPMFLLSNLIVNFYSFVAYGIVVYYGFYYLLLSKSYLFPSSINAETIKSFFVLFI